MISSIGITLFLLLLGLALKYFVLDRSFQGSVSSEDISIRKSKKLYKEILLGYNHKNIDLWFQWLTKQNKQYQNQAFAKILEYLGRDVQSLGSITKEILTVVAKFSNDEVYGFLENFVKKSIVYWYANKAIASFFQQALITLIKANSEKAAKFITTTIRTRADYPAKELINKYMSVALVTIEEENCLHQALQDIVLDNHISVEFKTETLEVMRVEEEKFSSACLSLLKTILEKNDIGNLLFEYCFIGVLDTANKAKPEVQELIIRCFLDEDLQNQALNNLIELLQNSNFYINLDLLFKILNVLWDQNYKKLAMVLKERLSLSSTEEKLFEMKSQFDLVYDDLHLEKFAYKIFKPDPKYKIDLFLDEEYKALKNTVKIHVAPMIKLVFGSAELEKLYLAVILASKEAKSLLIIDFDLIFDQGFEPAKLEQLFSQDPNKIVFLKNIKTLILNYENDNRKKEVVRYFSIIKKFLKFATNNFIVSFSENYTDLIEKDYMKKFFEENQDIISNSYTFDVSSLARKKELFSSIVKYLDTERESNLENFEDIQDAFVKLPHLKLKRLLLSFMHDSILVYKKIISFNKYQALMNDELIKFQKKSHKKINLSNVF